MNRDFSDEHRRKLREAWTPERRARQAALMRALHAHPGFQEAQRPAARAAMKRLQSDPAFVARRVGARRAAAAQRRAKA